MDSSESIGLDGQSQPGPDLPLKLAGHCLVKINETTIFMGGGLDNKNFYFHILDQTWIPAPSFNIPRFLQGCALQESDGYHLIFVAGGTQLFLE